MTPSELAAYFRTQVHDEKAPFLWTVADVYRYMNLAYFEWVRRIGGLRDSTSDMTQVVVPAGVAVVTLDTLIIKVLNARTDRGQLTLYGSQDYEALNRLAVSGPVRALVLGEGESQARAIDTPTEDTTVALVVRRLPLEKVTAKSEAFEVPDDQSGDLVFGMMRHAFLKDDPDTYDKARSDRSYATFMEAANRAAAEARRTNHTPGVVQYGGI